MKAKTDISSLLHPQEMPEAMSPVPCAVSDIANTLNDCLFINAIRSKMEVTYDAFIQLNNEAESAQTSPTMKITVTKSKAKYKLTPEILAQKWNIGLETAKRTLTWSHSNPPISGTTVLLPSDVLARYM